MIASIHIRLYMGLGSSAAALLAAASPAIAQWTFVNLQPTQASNSECYGAAGDQQGGNGIVNSVVHAGIWTGTPGSWVDLHPAAATTSRITAMMENAQAGHATVNGRIHAAVWTGTAASFVDYNPVNPPILSSAIFAIWGQRKAGRIQVGIVDHACVWGGSANSVADLHPPAAVVEADSSYALGVDATRVVGYINTSQPNATTRPSVWTGDALSWHDLTPPGSTAGMAYATEGTQIAGVARIGGDDHAALWNGNTYTWTDLHPGTVPGVQRSYCYGVYGGTQVGETLLNDSNRHAAVWDGTVGSYFDLHTVATGGGYLRSSARAVWKDAQYTYVAGYVSTGSFNQAALWRRPNPVPSCRADVAGLGGTAGSDGTLTVDDLIFYLNAFFTGNLGVADISGLGGSTTPDGQLTPDDIIAFLTSFFSGC
ncbi:MAG: GC-type dockerin domain-anchored protein [Phycisphaerales bacterium]